MPNTKDPRRLMVCGSIPGNAPFQKDSNPKPQKYEYARIGYSDGTKFIHTLNSLARSGWELIQIISSGEKAIDAYTAYLKREVSPVSQTPNDCDTPPRGQAD